MGIEVDEALAPEPSANRTCIARRQSARKVEGVNLEQDEVDVLETGKPLSW